MGRGRRIGVNGLMMAALLTSPYAVDEFQAEMAPHVVDAHSGETVVEHVNYEAEGHMSSGTTFDGTPVLEQVDDILAAGGVGLVFSAGSLIVGLGLTIVERADAKRRGHNFKRDGNTWTLTGKWTHRRQNYGD